MNLSTALLILLLVVVVWRWLSLTGVWVRTRKNVVERSSKLLTKLKGVVIYRGGVGTPSTEATKVVEVPSSNHRTCTSAQDDGQETTPSGYSSADAGDLYVDELDIEKNGFKETMQRMALEPSVEKSHRRFVKDLHHRTTGASTQSVLSGDNDVNKFVGLRRVAYNTAAQASSDARTVHSEDPEEMPEYNEFCL